LLKGSGVSELHAVLTLTPRPERPDASPAVQLLSFGKNGTFVNHLAKVSPRTLNEMERQTPDGESTQPEGRPFFSSCLTRLPQYDSCRLAQDAMLKRNEIRDVSSAEVKKDVKHVPVVPLNVFSSTLHLLLNVLTSTRQR
jgi:hypothetical protein